MSKHGLSNALEYFKYPTKPDCRHLCFDEETVKWSYRFFLLWVSFARKKKILEAFPYVMISINFASIISAKYHSILHHIFINKQRSCCVPVLLTEQSEELSSKQDKLLKLSH